VIAPGRPLIVLRGRVRVKPDPHEEEMKLARERDRQEARERLTARRLGYRVNPVRGLVREPTLTCKACGRRYLLEALLRQAERDTAAAFAKGVDQIMGAQCVCGSNAFD
jgi:hypothetical protein